MFSLFKKSRNGFWDKDKLYDLDTGILLAEIYYFQITKLIGSSVSRLYFFN